MKEYTIYPLKVGQFHGIEKSCLSYLTDAGTKLDAPVIMYLIKGDDTSIVVDTGCSEPELAEKYHRKTDQPDWMKPVNALRAHGVEPEDVTIVINTHLHWDHCYNNDKFPNAKIYVQRREMEFAAAPLPTQHIYYESGKTGLTPPWVKTITQYEIIEGDYPLMDGIDIIFTPGHTPGFQSVLVNTSGGRYMIASDCVGLLENWNNTLYGSPVISGIHVDVEEYYRTLAKIRKLCDHVLPGHDEKVFEHTVYPHA